MECIRSHADEWYVFSCICFQSATECLETGKCFWSFRNVLWSSLLQSEAREMENEKSFSWKCREFSDGCCILQSVIRSASFHVSKAEGIWTERSWKEKQKQKEISLVLCFSHKITDWRFWFRFNVEQINCHCENSCLSEFMEVFEIQVTAVFPFCQHCLQELSSLLFQYKQFISEPQNSSSPAFVI